jgi:hypothetical protein
LLYFKKLFSISWASEMIPADTYVYNGVFL